MALSENRIVYGIHSICPYNRTTQMPYGILKVVGGGQLSLTSEFEELFAGSQKFPWATEAKTISAEFSATVKSMPDFLFELFLGATVSTTASSATGTVSTTANKTGTSVVAATGIVDVGLKSGSSADLKAGLYVVKVVTATTVDVYQMTDIEFANGTDIDFENDALKITASPLTIVQSTATEIPNTGLELNGGAGVIGMTTDDTAWLEVAAAHGGISDITIGASTTTFPSHGQLALAQKRSNGDLFMIEIYNAIAAGFPIGLTENTFSIPELTVKLQYDTAKDAVAKIRAIKAA